MKLNSSRTCAWAPGRLAFLSTSMFRCCVTGWYGACLHSTRRATDECRRCLPDWRIPFDSRLRSYVLDSKLKKNQSPAFIRLAGFRSQPLFPIFFNRTSNLTFRPHPPPFTMKAKGSEEHTSELQSLRH